jgi:hypothetical protein
MPSPLIYKTADWRGVIRPDLDPPHELVTFSVRIPKELAEDVEFAAHEYRKYFHSPEELMATAVGYAINSLAEDPPPTSPKVSPKNRRSKRKRRKADTSFVDTAALGTI